MEHEPIKRSDVDESKENHKCRCGLAFDSADMLQFHCDVMFYKSIQVPTNSLQYRTWDNFEAIHNIADKELLAELACWTDLEARLRAIYDQR